MRFVAFLLSLWALCGCAVIVMMIYGAFEPVAMNEPVMAAVLATGTAFLSALATLLGWRAYRRARRGRL